MLDPSAVGIDRPASLDTPVQHDPSSNQSVIDPVVRLRIPMARQLYMYVRVCVYASSLYSFGWAAGSVLHLVNLYTAVRMYPKAIVMGRVVSLYLHRTLYSVLYAFPFSSPITPPIQSAALIRCLMKALSSQTRIHSHGGTS